MADVERDQDSNEVEKKPHRVMSAGLSTAVYAKLQRAAQREGRSVSSYLARLIEKDMKKQRV